MKRLLASFLLIAVTLSLALPLSASADSQSSVVGQVTSTVKWSEAVNYYIVDNSQFKMQLYKGSTGYDKLYSPDGSVAIYDNRFTLEYQQGTNWKQRGVPVSVDLKDNKDSIDVVRHYTDYLSTTYDVIYTFKADEPIKITIDLHSGQTDNYRVVWSPSGITGEGIYDTYQLDFDKVAFNWRDVRFSLGNITTYNVSEVASGKKAEITFALGTVLAGQNVVIDPSIIGASTQAYAATNTPQRKTFYAEGRHWVFYSDGTNVGYNSSDDNGASWKGFTTIAAGVSSVYIPIFYDGTYVDYARYNANNIYYRRGTPESDGTITWLAAEQLAVNGIARPPTYTYYYTICIATDSIAYIGYINNANRNAYVTRNSEVDGTWADTVGFLYNLSGVLAKFSFVIPLEDGEIFAAYITNIGVTMKGRLYDGAWGAEETCTDAGSAVEDNWSFTSYNGIIEMAYVDSTDQLVLVSSRATDGTWDEVEIYDGINTYCAVSLTSIGADLVLFYWERVDDHIYYINRIAGVWDVGGFTDWIDEEVELLSGLNNMTSSYANYGNYLGVLYEVGSTPYDMMYAYLESTSEPTVTNSAADNITSVGADLHGEVTDDGGDAVTTVGFEWDIDSGAPYANDWNTAYSADVFAHTFATMPPNDTIYWRAYATNGVGTSYSGELNFNTLLPLPLPPTSFTATQTGTNSITLDWVTGTYADTTIIRAKEESYPVDITDGYEVYDGALETLDIDGLNLGTSTYYYRAWSENVTGYSTDTADTNIGGENMLFLGLLFGAIALTAIGYTKGNVPVVYGGAGIWAVFAGYSHGQAASIALNTGTWDTYGMLFWIAIAMVIVCMLEPKIRARVTGLAEDTAIALDEEGEANADFDKLLEDRKAQRERLDRFHSSRPKRRRRSKFSSVTGKAIF